MRFHDLRHTAGTLMSQKMPLVTVQAILGHAHISTTMRYSCVEAGDEAALISAAFRAEAAPVADPVAA